jgi:enoyl-CoA hydratase
MAEVVVTKYPWGAKVALNRPPVNAVSTALAIELDTVFARLSEEKPLVVVLTGQGAHFCAGADMKEVHPDVKSAVLRQDKVVGLQRRLREVPFPMIAAVQGACLGLGMVMATICDIRLAREDAAFGIPEVKRGRAGGLSAIRPLVSEGFARLMAFGGDSVGAEQAVQVGLAEQLVSKADWEKTVDGLAESIAANGEVALYAIKASLKRTGNLPPDIGLWAEQQVAYRLWTEGERHVWE